MTQAQLGERADVATETISRVERGQLTPSVDVLARIASALEVTVDELLSATKTPKKRTGIRPAVQRIIALVEPLSDGEIDDLRKSLMAILRVGGRHPPRRRTPTSPAGPRGRHRGRSGVRRSPGTLSRRRARRAATETISRVERGQLTPSVDVLARIASALEVTVDELLSATKTPKKRTGIRPAVQRIIALVEPLSDGEIDDLRKSLMAILRVGGRHPPRRRTPT